MEVCMFVCVHVNMVVQLNCTSMTSNLLSYTFYSLHVACAGHRALVPRFSWPSDVLDSPGEPASETAGKQWSSWRHGDEEEEQERKAISVLVPEHSGNRAGPPGPHETSQLSGTVMSFTWYEDMPPGTLSDHSVAPHLEGLGASGILPQGIWIWLTGISKLPVAYDWGVCICWMLPVIFDMTS